MTGDPVRRRYMLRGQLLDVIAVKGHGERATTRSLGFIVAQRPHLPVRVETVDRNGWRVSLVSPSTQETRRLLELPAPPPWREGMATVTRGKR